VRVIFVKCNFYFDPFLRMWDLMFLRWWPWWELSSDIWHCREVYRHFREANYLSLLSKLKPLGQGICSIACLLFKQHYKWNMILQKKSIKFYQTAGFHFPENNIIHYDDESRVFIEPKRTTCCVLTFSFKCQFQIVLILMQ
jgi:hypothetical protein